LIKVATGATWRIKAPAMKMTSYAQNREDVLLMRALRRVANGFYIDVGANDPVKDSVTKCFYDLGWRGINIDALECVVEKLNRERPRDTNVRTLVGKEESEATFFEIPEDTRLSTVDGEIARGYETKLGYSVKTSNVAMTTLSSICAQNGVSEIHFLKIDVEGQESSVISGFDFTRWRPWILLIEATKPYTQEDASHEWEAGIIEAGYQCVFFDGLSKYYLSSDHGELRQHFNAPPNVFDNFIPYEEMLLQKKVHVMENNVREMVARLAKTVFERARKIVSRAR
jgi:FkbM family methyltransferase